MIYTTIARPEYGKLRTFRAAKCRLHTDVLFQAKTVLVQKLASQPLH